MIIDAHLHVFPHFKGSSGFKDAETHLRMQQQTVKRFWGRMVSNTLDPQYAPLQDEEVDFRVGKFGRYEWKKYDKNCWLRRFPTMMVEMEWPSEYMVAHMDEVGVDKGVLQAGYMEINYCREYFAECMRKYPGRFIGTIAIDYDIQKDEKYRGSELDKLRDWVINKGMKGVFQGFPRSQRDKMDDVRFDPLWLALCTLKVPHIFITGFESKEGYLASLSALENVVRKFPDLIAVIGHLGGNVQHPGDPNFTGTPEELLPLLGLPNVYFELGYVLAYENWNIWKHNYEYPYPLHTRLIRRIYDEIGVGRLLWGSDMPNIYRTCTYQQCLDIVRLHFDFMNEQEKQMVLCDNAAAVFKVTE